MIFEVNLIPISQVVIVDVEDPLMVLPSVAEKLHFKDFDSVLRYYQDLGTPVTYTVIVNDPDQFLALP